MARRRGQGRLQSGQLEHGQRPIVEGLEQATPDAPPVPPTGGDAPPVPQGPPATPGNVDLFGPTQMPNQPIDAGMQHPGVLDDDPDEMLRAIYQMYPHDDIRALLEAREF